MNKKIKALDIKIYPDIPTPTSMKAGSFLDAEFMMGHVY